jgi:hypothetical protein
MVQIECKITCFFAEMQPILATFVAKVARNAELLLSLQENLGIISILRWQRQAIKRKIIQKRPTPNMNLPKSLYTKWKSIFNR